MLYIRYRYLIALASMQGVQMRPFVLMRMGDCVQSTINYVAGESQKELQRLQMGGVDTRKNQNPMVHMVDIDINRSVSRVVRIQLPEPVKFGR